MVIVRHERPEDAAAVRRVNERAFGRPDEADLVERVRRRGEIPTISLVAMESEIVGHVLFSPVTVESEAETWEAMGLGPLAVLPEHQRRGVGSQLVQAGLEACRAAGWQIVVVLGHPDYYPRFGFVPSRRYGIEWEGQAPEEAFMVVELEKGALAGRRGVVRYLPEFDGV